MATVKLKGWFAPKVAAQINRREDNSYYIGAADKVPSVNGQAIGHPTKLSSGDIIRSPESNSSSSTATSCAEAILPTASHDLTVLLKDGF